MGLIMSVKRFIVQAPGVNVMKFFFVIDGGLKSARVFVSSEILTGNSIFRARYQPTRAQCYKTSFRRNLQMGQIS
jgi:hypothetical protein